MNSRIKIFFSKIQLLYLLTYLFACAFLYFFCFFVSHMSELMPYWLVEGHFEQKHLKKGKCKVDWTLRFLNDLELYACLA